MSSYDQVAIVGVGLLGGSIALALKQRDIASEVIGIGRTESKLQAAVDQGLIDRATTNLADGVQSADLVVVCTPVDLVVDTVSKVLQECPPTCLVTDVGSTKGDITRDLAQLAGRFVGSHPLAGDHRSGSEFARADLLNGKVVVVTPTDPTPNDITTAVCHFWELLGANVVWMGPDEHDAALAATSHLPHMIASALAAATPSAILQLAATGWADTTRVASADAALWRQIFLANREPVLAAVDQFEHQLTELRAALAANDGAKLEQLLAEGKRIRDALAN